MKFNALRRRFEDQGTSFVIRDFEDFYLQLLKYKSIIAGTPVTQDELEAIAPQAISDTLKTTLERMSMDASQKGGEYATSYFEEAMFIMSALADEFFLNLAWEGRQYWEDHLLESRLFGTHDAGDIFFKNLDNFLGARDPMRRDLAEVYLLALGLGFQGKYRNTEDGGKLKAYRHQLYIFIHHHEPRLYKDGERLFPEVYNFTLAEGPVRYLQDVRQWMIVFLILFTVLFIVSIGVWTETTSRLHTVIDRISNLVISQE